MHEKDFGIVIKFRFFESHFLLFFSFSSQPLLSLDFMTQCKVCVDNALDESIAKSK